MDAGTGDKLRVMAAAVRAAPLAGTHKHIAGEKPIPFVTISREGGAGGHSVGRCLVDRLNQLDPGEEPWRLWDRELVEKVAGEHHLSPESVATLGETHRTWFGEFVASLSQVPEDDEVKVYRRVAITIRTLAQRGRAVIVGRGGAYVTNKMPGGTHCRLLAPLNFRTATMARQLGISPEAALEHVRVLDRNRLAFLRRYWPGEVWNSDIFSITLNTSLVTEEQAAEAIVPLVLGVKRPATQAMEF